MISQRTLHLESSLFSDKEEDGGIFCVLGEAKNIESWDNFSFWDRVFPLLSCSAFFFSFSYEHTLIYIGVTDKRMREWGELP